MEVKNTQEVELICGFELEEQEQEEEKDNVRDYETELYFRYRGCLYGLYEFTLFENNIDFTNWHAYLTLTSTSMLVIRVSSTLEEAIVGMV